MKNSIKLSLFFLLVYLVGCSEANKASVSKDVTVATEQNNLIQITKKLGSPAFVGVDVINDVILPKAGSVVPIKGDKISIAGYSFDERNGDAAAGVLLLIDGKSYVAIYGGERADIAKVLNNPKYLKSQFYVSIPTAEIGVGQHEVKFRVIASDKSGYYENDWAAKLDVKQ